MNDAKAKEIAAEHLDNTVGGPEGGYKVKHVDNPHPRLKFVYSEIWGKHDDEHDRVIVVVDEKEERPLDSGPEESIINQYDPDTVLRLEAEEVAEQIISDIVDTNRISASYRQKQWELSKKMSHGTESVYYVVKVGAAHPIEDTPGPFGVILELINAESIDPTAPDPHFTMIEKGPYEEIKEQIE